MAKYHGFAITVGLALLLSGVQCDVNCNGAEGRGGLAGMPGRDGQTGMKGEKGEPAKMRKTGDVDFLQLPKGDVGSRGVQGPVGPKGYRGDLGPSGRPGEPGQPGRDGANNAENVQAVQQAWSAFSVIRTDNTYPPYNQRITYQTEVVNRPGDFNINTGYFTCRVAGVYYFDFHSVAKASICLRIASNALRDPVGYCDYNSRGHDQVLSGGVVLQLTAGQRVWLESFQDAQSTSESRGGEKQIIFNGFLITADS